MLKHKRRLPRNMILFNTLLYICIFTGFHGPKLLHSAYEQHLLVSLTIGPNVYGWRYFVAATIASVGVSRERKKHAVYLYVRLYGASVCLSPFRPYMRMCNIKIRACLLVIKRAHISKSCMRAMLPFSACSIPECQMSHSSNIWQWKICGFLCKV